MKIKFKRIHIIGVLSFISVTSGYHITQSILRELSQKGMSILIVPSIFILSSLYVYNYFREYDSKIKIAEEVAKEISEGDIEKEEKIKKHLIEKISNEENIL